MVPPESSYPTKQALDIPTQQEYNKNYLKPNFKKMIDILKEEMNKKKKQAGKGIK